MSARAVRTGPPSLPVTTAAGTDNDLTDPRILTFVNPVRPCIVHNLTGNGNTIRVKINNTTDFDNDSDDDGPGHLSIADGETRDVSFEGRVNVETVSFVTLNALDDLDLVSVRGWSP